MIYYAPYSTSAKKVVFIDEMPWMDTPKSGFVPALENFWNAWASARKDVLLIVCGSATSWIISKILRNRGGLHNRVTVEIPLSPFTLRECELYAESRKLGMSRRQIVECYMALGGIPYYWRLLAKGLSPAQNFDSLFFAKDARLRMEYSELYASLFKSPEPYERIVAELGRRGVGLTRDEIAAATGMCNSGTLTRRLEELERIQRRRRVFREETRTRKAVHLTLVVSPSLSRNCNSGELQSVVELDDLFAAAKP